MRNETMQLGGEANVVNNLRSLEAEVELAGVIRLDNPVRRILLVLDRLRIDNSGPIQLDNREIIRKSLIIAHKQQVRVYVS